MVRKQVEYRLENGRRLASVPLGRKGDTWAEMWADDFDFLVRLGVSQAWTDGIGYVTTSAHLAPGGNISVARCLLDAKPGQLVRFRNRNPYDLRKENLELIEGGYSLKRDRDYITPENKRKRNYGG